MPVHIFDSTALAVNLFDKLTEMTDLFKELFRKMSDYKLSETLGIEHFTDYIDIGLLIIFVFCALRYIKKRRAGKMLSGLIVLMIIYFICELLNLHTVSFVFQCFLGGGILVFVVLFAGEIRQALEKFGTLPELLFGARYHKGGKETCVDRLMDAITAISLSEKMGAIIVIEGYTKLDDHIGRDKGHNTIVNADISTELLKTIFMNGTELHDGGVIIRGGRIYAASCYFEPTKRTDYINHINSSTGHPLGSRHQAAIGLSEQSDAIIIVVSEETHAMSVAYKSEILIDLSTDQLHGVVKAAMTGSEKDVKGIVEKLKKVKIH